MTHMAILFGVTPTWKFYSEMAQSSKIKSLAATEHISGPVLYSILAYLIGLVFYAFDFPERVYRLRLFDTVSEKSFRESRGLS